MNFNFKKASIFKLAKISRSPFVKFSFILHKPILLLSFVFLLIFFTNFESLFFGFFISFFFLSLLFWQVKLFFKSKPEKIESSHRIEEVLKNPNNFDLAGFFDFKSAKAIYGAIKKRKKGINSYNLAWHILSENPEFNFIFTRMGVSFSDVKYSLRKIAPKEEADFLYTKDFEDTIVKSLEMALIKNRTKVISEDVLVALSETNPFIKKIFLDSDFEKEDILNLVYWLEEMKGRIENKNGFWKWENLIKKGSLARDWSFGYTVTLDKFSTDWTYEFRKTGFPDMVGHKKEFKEMERILSREEINNALLIGERGTGRKAMIYELAKKSFYEASLPEINNKRIVELNLPFLLAQTNNNEEVESLLDSIFKEVIFSGNIILIISDFESFIATEPSPGKLNISGIISSYLNLSKFQIVAITDWVGYRKNIEKISSVASYFEKVEVSESSEKETLILLQKISLTLEAKYKKIISYLALKSIISYSAKHLPNLPFPKKAIDLLDESIIYLSQVKGKILLPGHVAKIVSQKSGVPVGDMDQKEKDVLMNLEKLIHERIINQERAVSDISSALRRSRVEVYESKKPMGSFLFLGPTGVGKTETAKALASCYFGSDDKMIRIDMSEFQNLSDISSLIGSSENEGLLTTKVREKPFSLILLDEIEKAHPDILNIFLQVLDEGHLTDGFQRKINFKNTIIVATSNAGSQFIMENINNNLEWKSVKENLLKNLFENNIFRPEFINRFDDVVLFKPLTKENLLRICDLFLNKIVEGMEKKGIIFITDEEIKNSLIEIGYDPKFGARELKRTIQNKIEDSLASAILSGKIKKGDKVKINSSFEVEKIY